MLHRPDAVRREDARVVASPSRNWLRQVGIPWSTFVVGSGFFLRPVLTTVIVADDFVNPFAQFTDNGLSVTDTLRNGFSGTSATGHFNYLGQTLGAVYNYVWFWLASSLGIRFSTTYALTKLAVFVLCAAAVASVVRECCRVGGRIVTPWQSRIASAILFFGTLQLHNAWSNDPVGSYPLSGFAAAAMGLWFITLCMRRARSASSISAWRLGAYGAAIILYYEINIAAVAAGAIPVAYTVLTADRSTLLRSVRRHLPAFALPAVLTIALQLRAAPQSANYTGTSVDVGSGIVSTFRVSVLSSFPGAGWNMTREFLNGPLVLRTSAFLTLAFVGILLSLLPRHRPVASAEGPRWIALGAFLLAPVGFWLLATALQASTQKVQAEVTRVGFVYNFYAMGSAAIAVLLAVAYFCVPAGRIRSMVEGPVLVLAGLFVIAQLVVNWNLSERINAANEPNRRLLVSYSEQWDQERRCTALWDWSYGAWPEYYERGVISGLQDGYVRFHGEAFCPGFVRPPQ